MRTARWRPSSRFAGQRSISWLDDPKGPAEHRLLADSYDVIRVDGALEAAQGELADRLDLHALFHLAEDPLRDQHLPGLRFAAEPRRKIGDRPDRPIVAALFEADRAERGVA